MSSWLLTSQTQVNSQSGPVGSLPEPAGCRSAPPAPIATDANPGVLQTQRALPPPRSSPNHVGPLPTALGSNHAASSAAQPEVPADSTSKRERVPMRRHAYTLQYHDPTLEDKYLMYLYETRRHILLCWVFCLAVCTPAALPSMAGSVTSRLALLTLGISIAVWLIVIAATVALSKQAMNILATRIPDGVLRIATPQQHHWLLARGGAFSALRTNCRLQEFFIILAEIAGFVYSSYTYPARSINCNQQAGCESFVDIDAILLFFFPIVVVISPLRIVVLVPLLVTLVLVFFVARMIPNTLPVDYALVASFAVVTAAMAALTTVTAFFHEKWTRGDFEKLYTLYVDARILAETREYVMNASGYMIPPAIARRIAAGEAVHEKCPHAAVAVFCIGNYFTEACESGPYEIVQKLQWFTTVLDACKGRFPLVMKFHAVGDYYVAVCGPHADELLSTTDSNAAAPMSPADTAQTQKRVFCSLLFEFVSHTIGTLLSVEAEVNSISASNPLLAASPCTRVAGSSIDACPVVDVFCALDVGEVHCMFSASNADYAAIGKPLQRCDHMLRTMRSTGTDVRPQRSGRVSDGEFESATLTMTAPATDEQDRGGLVTVRIVASHAMHEAVPRIEALHVFSECAADTVAWESDEEQGDTRTSFFGEVDSAKAPPEHSTSYDAVTLNRILTQHNNASSQSEDPTSSAASPPIVPAGAALLSPPPLSLPSAIHRRPTPSVHTRRWFDSGTMRQRQYNFEQFPFRTEQQQNAAQSAHPKNKLTGLQSMEKIADEMKLERHGLVWHTFAREEMEFGFGTHVQELCARHFVEWQFAACSVMSLVFIAVSLTYRFAKSVSSVSIVCFGLSLLVDLLSFGYAVFQKRDTPSFVFFGLLSVHFGLWHVAFYIDAPGSMVHNEQLLWSVVVQMLLLLSEPSTHVGRYMIADALFQVPLIIHVFLIEGRSRKMQAYLVVGQLMIWLIGCIIRCMGDLALRTQFASKVQSLLYHLELEDDYTMMEDLMLVMVPHKVAVRLMAIVRNRREEYLHGGTPGRGHGAGPREEHTLHHATAAPADSNASDAAIRHNHIRTSRPFPLALPGGVSLPVMFVTRALDTPIACIHLRPSNASDPAKRSSSIVAAWADIHRHLAACQGVTKVKSTGDSCVFSDELHSFDDKFMTLFHAVCLVHDVAASHGVALQAVLHSGPMMGAVLGTLGLTFEYYGEACTTALAVLRDMPSHASSVVLTERYAQQCRNVWHFKEPVLSCEGSIRDDVVKLKRGRTCNFSEKHRLRLAGRRVGLYVRFVELAHKKAPVKFVSD